ncbi:MAG: hypothetical protein ABMA64_06175, partial [Myxococcota bacterium]
MNTNDIRLRLTVAMALVAGCGGDGRLGPVSVPGGAASRPEPPGSATGPTTGPRRGTALQAPTWSPTLTHLGTPARGHLQSFLVADAPPGASMYLVQGSYTVVGEAVVAPDGRAEFKLLVFEGVGSNSTWFEAVGEGFSTGPLEVPLEVVTPVEDLPEASPAFDLEQLVPGSRFRACIPHARVDRCSVTAEDLEPWEVRNVVNYALDAALPIDLRAEVCVFETAFYEDCCFDVALWDETTARDNLCTPWTGDDTGTTGLYYGRPFVVGTERREAPI